MFPSTCPIVATVESIGNKATKMVKNRDCISDLTSQMQQVTTRAGINLYGSCLCGLKASIEMEFVIFFGLLPEYGGYLTSERLSESDKDAVK
jgi:hypothetical protein